MSNTINITIPLNGRVTSFEIERAKCIALEKRIPYKAIEIPKMKYDLMAINRVNGHSFFSKLLPIKFLP